MAEIKFPLRRGSRRGAHASTPADPLAEMARQIRALDEAAERAAAQIAAAAESLRSGETQGQSATRAELLAGLGSALVERTEEIRADCGRLSALMDRTAKLLAERDARGPEDNPTPATQPVSEPPPAPVAEIRPAEIEQRAAIEPAGDPQPENGAVASEPEPPPPAEPVVSEPGPPPAAEPADRPQWLAKEDEDPSPSPAGTSEGVRLIATQMAIAGSSRSEIERRLRVQFGVRDADQALDDIFGTRRSEVG